MEVWRMMFSLVRNRHIPFRVVLNPVCVSDIIMYEPGTGGSSL
jgi:hypothetical protein